MPQDYCQICGEVKGVRYCEPCGEFLCPRCHPAFSRGLVRGKAQEFARLNR